jgi:hypothetical protein
VNLEAAARKGLAAFLLPGRKASHKTIFERIHFFA